MKVDVLLGLQWGDEGKGKIVDVFTPQYDIIARFQGGPNAGHTIEFEGNKQILHTVPSGIFHKDKINVIGNGVVIDPVILVKELDSIRAVNPVPEKNLLISKRAHLILPTHRLLDACYESASGKGKIGSTLKGISPVYTDKISRKGLRVGDIVSETFLEKYNRLKEQHFTILDTYKFNSDEQLIDKLTFSDYEKKWFEAINLMSRLKLADTEVFLYESLKNNKTVLAEGAQGSLLDIEFGSYPYVTSSNTLASGVCSGLGISPHSIGKIFGVFKAYCTRVGNGPFPTELEDETGEKMRQKGFEFGSTTGRPRRCGWLDLPALKYSIMLSGVDELIMTKADVLTGFGDIKVCTKYCLDHNEIEYIPFEFQSTEIDPKYDDFNGWNIIPEKCNKENLPLELKNYIKFIEQFTGVPVGIASLGPDREQTVILK